MSNAKIIEILENFGISSKRAAEIMGMSPGAFSMKKLEQNNNRFKEENLEALRNFIITESEKLKNSLDHIEKPL